MSFLSSMQLITMQLLGLPDKVRVIKRLIVCISWDVSAFVPAKNCIPIPLYSCSADGIFVR